MLITLCVMAKGPVTPAPAPLPPKSLPIAIIPQDGFNLQIEEQLDPYNVIVNLASPCHNWFAGTFTNLPTDKEVTIGLSMAGNDTKGNEGNVKKWEGLRPVMTYADPTKYETYEWFQKDAQGCWVSGDPFKQGDAKFAGTGKVPDQSAIPKEVTEQFLSEDGKYWQAWREVDKAKALPNINVFRITQRFSLPSATVAMRVPYTYTYQSAFLEKLQTARLPGVIVEEMGQTFLGRRLRAIRLDPPTNTGRDVPDCPTILVYAREHGTEQDGSWVIEGIIRWLLSEECPRETREKFTWFIIPILDPDDAYESAFKTGDIFTTLQPFSVEAYFYGNFFVEEWINKGRRVDIVINLHNVECNEGPNLFSPFVNRVRRESVYAFNRSLFDAAKAAGYSVGNPTGLDHGIMAFRFAGWCCLRFRAYELAFEANSRHPESCLTQMRTQQLGTLLAKRVVEYTTTRDFAEIEQAIRAHLVERAKASKAWWARADHTPAQRTLFELFSLGY